MFETIKVGDVVMLERQYSPKDLFSKRFIKYLYELAIVYFQTERFPDGYKWAQNCTHTLIYCGRDQFFEVTDPKAKFTTRQELSSHILATKRKWHIVRYNRYNFTNARLLRLWRVSLTRT
jgi:hypothetical protein